MHYSTLKRLVKEFIDLLEIVEVSDSENEFHPNRISSCRAYDGARMNELLVEMKKIVNE